MPVFSRKFCTKRTFPGKTGHFFHFSLFFVFAAVVHKLTLDALVRTGDLPLCNVKMSYLRTHNALGTERTFVPVTGGYIVRPVNVNGNWGTDGSVAITRNVGKNGNAGNVNRRLWRYCPCF